MYDGAIRQADPLRGTVYKMQAKTSKIFIKKKKMRRFEKENKRNISIIFY